MIKIKILVLSTTFPRWRGDSTAGFVFDLSEQLSRKGCEIIVLAPHHPGAEFNEEMGGLRVYRFPYFWPNRYQRLCYEGGILPNLRRSLLAKIQAPSLFISELWHALKLIKKEEIDLIHAHWVIPSGLVAVICKKIFRKPVVTTIHAGDVFPLRNSFLRYFIKTTLDASDVCTASSNTTKSFVLNITDVGDKTDVLSMGVDSSIFKPDQKYPNIKERYKVDVQEPLILCVGRLVEKKGVEYLIKGMPRILGRIPDAKLLICGNGPERTKLESLVEDLKLGDEVIFIGEVPNEDLPEIYNSADLFIQPSIIDSRGDTEGLSVVLLESMACGIPVIGSNVGGTSEVIRHGENGFLVPEKSPEDLADRTVELLSDKKLAEKFSVRGLETIRERFTWEVISERFMDVCNKAVK